MKIALFSIEAGDDVREVIDKIFTKNEVKKSKEHK